MEKCSTIRGLSLSRGLERLHLCLRPPKGLPGLASPPARCPDRTKDQHKCPQPPDVSLGGSASRFFTHAKTSCSRPRTSHGSRGRPMSPSVGKRLAWCRIQLGAGSDREMGRWGEGLTGPSWARASLWTLSLCPLHIPTEPADSGINSPHSNPLPASLCWSCHDNQSSPFMPKTPQKQQQKLHPPLEGKEVMARHQRNGKEGAWFNAPLYSRSPPETSA